MTREVAFFRNTDMVTVTDYVFQQHITKKNEQPIPTSSTQLLSADPTEGPVSEARSPSNGSAVLLDTKDDEWFYTLEPFNFQIIG
jgi:hypothetical protein